MFFYIGQHILYVCIIYFIANFFQQIHFNIIICMNSNNLNLLNYKYRIERQKNKIVFINNTLTKVIMKIIHRLIFNKMTNIEENIKKLTKRFTIIIINLKFYYSSLKYSDIFVQSYLRYIYIATIIYHLSIYDYFFKLRNLFFC